MLADWLSVDGRKAIEKMGWPEWGHEQFDDEGVVQQLRFQDKVASNGLSHWWLKTITPIGEHAGSTQAECPERAALALLRDRAREWLHEQCVWLVYEPGLEAWYAIRGYRRNQEERHSGKSAFEELTNDGWTNRLYEPDPLVWNDYDAALIAAVLATEKK